MKNTNENIKQSSKKRMERKTEQQKTKEHSNKEVEILMKMEMTVKMLVMLDDAGNECGDDGASDYGDILMMI